MTLPSKKYRIIDHPLYQRETEKVLDIEATFDSLISYLQEREGEKDTYERHSHTHCWNQKSPQANLK